MFPTDLVDLPNPDPKAPTNSPVTPLAGGIANLNAVVEALQAKVGVDGSAIAGSIDKRLAVTELVANQCADAIFPVPNLLQRLRSASSERPRLLIFGCSIAAQCSAYMAAQTTTTSAASEVVAGSTTIPVASVAGFSTSDTVVVPLCDSRLWSATIASVGASDIVLSTPTPAMVRKTTSITKVNSPTSNLGRDQGVGIANGAVYLLGGPADVVESWGHGGGIASQMIPYLQKELRWYEPHVVIFHLFENDMTGTVAAGAPTLDQMKAISRNVSKLCLEYGAVPIVCSSIPYNLIPASRAADYDGLYQYLTTQFATDVPGAIGVNLSTQWLDTSNSSFPRSPAAGWTDGVHPNTSRRLDAAAFLVPALTPVLPAYSSLLDVNLSKRETAVLSGDSGSLVGGVTGLAPDAWTIAKYGTAVCDASRNVDGSLKITGSWPGAANRTSDTIVARYTMTMPTSWPGSGAYFRVYALFKLRARVGIAEAYPQAYINSTGEYHRGKWGTDHAGSIPANGSMIMLETPRFSPSGANTTVQIGFNIGPTTAGSPANAAIEMDLYELGIIPAHQDTPVTWR